MIIVIAFVTHRIIAIAFCNMQDLHDHFLHIAVPYEVTIAYQAEFVTQSLLFLEAEAEGAKSWRMLLKVGMEVTALDYDHSDVRSRKGKQNRRRNGDGIIE